MFKIIYNFYTFLKVQITVCFRSCILINYNFKFVFTRSSLVKCFVQMLMSLECNLSYKKETLLGVTVSPDTFRFATMVNAVLKCTIHIVEIMLVFIDIVVNVKMFHVNAMESKQFISKM